MVERKPEWQIIRVASAEPRPGRRHEPAVQLSISTSEPRRISYGIGVMLDGEFRNRSFLDDRDIQDYVRLLLELSDEVRSEWESGQRFEAAICQQSTISSRPRREGDNR